MQLLFDENLSYKLCKRLEDIYPNSTHVRFVALEEQNDKKVWEYAKKEKYVIVSQDSNFNDISILEEFPPYIIWIKTGNTRLNEIEALLRKNFIRIKELLDNNSLGLIEIE